MHARRRAEQREGALLHLARQHADGHPLHVRRRVNRSQPVRDVTEAVLEPAEDAVIRLRFHALRERRAEAAVHGGARRRGVGEEERQIGDPEVGDLAGEVAARLIGHRQHAVFDEPREVFAFVAEVENVVEVLDVDVLAEFRLDAIADPLQRQAEPVGRRRVAAPSGSGSVWSSRSSAPSAARSRVARRQTRPSPRPRRSPPTP